MIDVPILVKDALRDGRLLKNYRILVLNDDGTTDYVIDNDTLVKETVSIDERMCSGDTIKFGLCEGSSLEFQYFDHPSIYGRQLQVFVDVWSDYAEGSDVPIWHDIKVLTETDGTFTVVKPGTYKIDYVGPISFKIEWTRNGVTYHDEIYPMAGADSYPLGDLVAGDTIRAYTDYASYEFSVDLKGYYADVSHWYTIPMGFFTVEKCSRQASTGIKKVTAYNKLKSEYLDQKANSLLLDSLDDDSLEMTIFSIRNTLLQDYEINPYIYKQREPDSYGGWSYSLITNSVKLSNLTDDGGPINYYALKDKAQEYGVTLTTNTNLNIRIYSRALYFDDLPTNQYYQIIQEGHDFGKLSINFADYLIDFLNACPLSKTGEEIVNNVKNMDNDPVVTNDGGWRELFSISLYRWQHFSYHYNDYAYKYQNDGTYQLEGSASDFIKQLFDVGSHTGLGFYVPVSIGIYLNDYSRLATFPLIGAEYMSYQGQSVTKLYPEFRYENGAAISYSGDNPFDDWLGLYEVEGVSEADLITVTPSDLPDFTLRDITSAAFETLCQFGKLDRVTDLFAGVELNNSRLFPAENLYPYNSLYPDGAALSSEKSMYSKLWADEGNIQKWRNLIITYKGLDENNQEKDFTLQRQVNADGTQDYNMSDNWLFKNLIWTASQVGDYADAMVAKMQDMTWFPFEMWCAGLPYLETGDEIEVSIGETTYTTYVLQRQLKGIQNLQDTYINGTLDIF